MKYPLHLAEENDIPIPNDIKRWDKLRPLKILVLLNIHLRNGTCPYIICQQYVSFLLSQNV